MGFVVSVCVYVYLYVLPVNVFLVGTGLLCGFRKEGGKHVGEAESERRINKEQ